MLSSSTLTLTLTLRLPIGSIKLAFRNPKPFSPYLYTRHFISSSSSQMPPSSSSSSSKVVVEYAKSNRSSCKKCSQPIDKGVARLGLVSRDSRGFDMTKWHHFNCFPFGSESVCSVEAINGFSLLKNGDQEALTMLLEGSAKVQEKPSIGGENTDNNDDWKLVRKREDDEENGVNGRNSKTVKLSLPKEEAKVDIVLSVSDIKDMYKDAKLSPKWKAFQTVIFLERDDGNNGSSKIAAFDFDGCLVKTSVKRVGPDAWSLLYSSVPEKLQALCNDGYKLVIFTNESNIERWKNKRQVAVDSKIGRLNNFIKLVNVPIQVFIACGLGQSDDPYRKPKTGMWTLMEKYFNSGIPIDLNQSFYVGDAAGRMDDHSDADIKFAEAIGVKFFLPEEYFKA